MPIPASQLVSVQPGVLAAGGDAVDLNGLLLTANTRVPIGTVLQFASVADVSSYFGPSAIETQAAAVYFAGTTVSTKLPGALLFSQYNSSNVAAYLRGGSMAAITLAQLQALTGSLTVVIDGVTKTAASVVLSAATSFSNAAEIIGADLGIEGSQIGTVTGSIGGTFTCTSSGTTLTVSAALTGSLQVGDVVSGTDGTNSLPVSCNIVQQLTGTPGAAGTYKLSAAATPGNLGSCTVTSVSSTLNVTVDSGTVISAGDVITGSSITANTYVVSQISGTTGGVGLYTLSNSMTVGSETVTVFRPAVTFDSVQSAFIITSATTGASSTISFATGTIAASLLLTHATGAVTSQGAVATTPSGAMNAIVAITNAWACFATLFDPDNGSGTTNKLLFALWTSQQNNRYLYAAYDTDITPTTTVPATTSLGYLLKQNNYSGTVPVYEPAEDFLAVFVLAWAASIDFTAVAGRTVLAYRGQSGLNVSVTDGTVALNLLANNYNFYGSYSENGTLKSLFQNGSISGEFAWADSYVNQIWMNANFQQALLTLLQNAKSIPYTAAGRATIAAALNDPIQAAGSFGAWQAGVTLSAAQIAEVNAAAGANIGGTLQTVGWYLQVGAASPSTRASRGSPPITFWYCDGGSVQSISMASIELQ